MYLIGKFGIIQIDIKFKTNIKSNEPTIKGR